jgi:osmoprotectant transport system substrate-binding protein
MLAPLLALVFLAAACGDGDDTDETEAEDTTTSEAAGADAEDTTTSEAAGAEEEGDDGAAPVTDGPTITIGAQDFGESAILAELYGQALAGAGYDVAQQSVGGFRDVSFAAFESGDVNFTVEYAASALEFLNEFAGEASSDIDETASLLDGQLSERGITAFDHSAAVDSNAFVVTRETADTGIAAISDLTEDMALGGPQDCGENASCIPGLIEVYGIDLSANFVPLDGAGPLTVAALDGGEVDVAVLFSTQGAIAANDFVVLEDDQGMINADNIIPIAADEVVEAYGEELAAVVNSVSELLTTEELAEMNRRFDIDKEDAEVIASEWLADNGLAG